MILYEQLITIVPRVASKEKAEIHYTKMELSWRLKTVKYQNHQENDP